MKIVKSYNNEITEVSTVNSIDNLTNDTMILLERGDKIKKAAKGAKKTRFKNVYSVKSLKEAIVINSDKMEKKTGISGTYCAVCGDWHTGTTDICSICQIRI